VHLFRGSDGHKLGSLVQSFSRKSGAARPTVLADGSPAVWEFSVDVDARIAAEKEQLADVQERVEQQLGVRNLSDIASNCLVFINA